MRFELRTGSNGRRVIIWSDNDNEGHILGSFTGKPKVELDYAGYSGRGKVNKVTICFEDEAEPECES